MHVLQTSIKHQVQMLQMLYHLMDPSASHTATAAFPARDGSPIAVNEAGRLPPRLRAARYASKVAQEHSPKMLSKFQRRQKPNEILLRNIFTSFSLRKSNLFAA